MSLKVYYICIFVLLTWTNSLVLAKPFISCEKKTIPENRKLFVALCDTRSGWKEFKALSLWNVTGHDLYSSGLSMKNVCKGRSWDLGFLTKPVIYLEYIKQLIKLENPLNTYLILMDSDTFWGTSKIEDIWRTYDCARGKKDILMSSEMSCWVGRYCQQPDIDRWYNDSQDTPSYSPFVNSGVVMGSIAKLEKMLEYVIANNKSYYTVYKPKKGPKFDDQYAYVDYAKNIAPNDVAIDYHQQFAATCSVHAVGPTLETGWPFACKSRNGTIYLNCPIYHVRHVVDNNNCFIKRDHSHRSDLTPEMETLSSNSVIWHGNGAGKQTCLNAGHRSYKCHLNKRGMTEEIYHQTFSE